MKIIISGKPKEIADLATELQGQPKEKSSLNDDVIKKQIDLVSKVSPRCHSIRELCLLSHSLTELLRL